MVKPHLAHDAKPLFFLDHVRLKGSLSFFAYTVQRSPKILLELLDFLKRAPLKRT